MALSIYLLYNMERFFILLVGAIVLISGCTIPGLDFGGGQLQSKYENDIVIIKDQSVFPQSVKANQQITLVTYVQNVGERQKIPVTISLYDTCGVFNSITNQEQTSDLLPREVKEIKWTLIPDTTKVKVPIPSCKLKVAVSYKYSTSSQTEIYFINSNEAQRQQEEGKFVSKTSTPQKAEGPVVAYIVPDSNVRQPIATSTREAYFPVSLYVENKGSGFLTSELKVSNLDIKYDNLGFAANSGCPIESKKVEAITLIGKKSPPKPCNLKTPTDTDVPKEATKRISVDFKDPYSYEFRKESSVTIEPVGYEAPKSAAN